MDYERLSTAEVAKFCGVNVRTVVRWIERGELQAGRLPGRSGRFQISAGQFIDFARGHQIPVPQEIAGRRRVMVLEQEPLVRSLIGRVLGGAGFNVKQVEPGFDAGFQVALFKPRVLILDLGMPGHESAMAVLGETPELETCRVLGLLDPPDAARKAAALEAGAAKVMIKPLDSFELLEVVRKVASGR